jgi:glycosyltransferase involved in cell wall biosynthesis
MTIAVREKIMGLKSQPLVSIVTPVYNTERYLAECIESVLAQTYQSWEYVIVDNCSTDRSLEIARHYARQDARIRVCSNDEFLNQMQNWNHAMRQISPESTYCKVVHADDWLFPECITRMVELAEAHPSVGIVSAYRLDETRVNLDGLPYPSTVILGRELCRMVLMGGPYVFGSPTSLLIRSDLIRKREKFYDESTISADTQVCFDLLQESDFGFVHQVLTYTRRHNESVTSLTHRFDIWRPGSSIALAKYGPIYLDNEEYERRLEQVIDNYHSFLARRAFGLAEKAFWRYHKNELKKLGYKISLAKLIKHSFLELLNLRETAGRIKLALKERTHQEARGWDAVLGSIYTQEDSDENGR